MQKLLETFEHSNATLPFVFALEHNSIYLRFTNKFLAKERELREIKEVRRMVHRQTQQKEPEWWTRRFDKGKEQLNLGGREIRKEISKEKCSDKENSSQDECRSKEVVKEVTSEEKIIPTMVVMSMIGKKYTEKIRRKVGSKRSVISHL